MRTLIISIYNAGKITIEDLYNLKEDDIIRIIENSKYKNIYKKWKYSKRVRVSNVEPKNVYYVHHGAKARYINPLVNGIRITDICKLSRKMIDKNLEYDMSKYVFICGINFEE